MSVLKFVIITIAVIISPFLLGMIYDGLRNGD